VTLDLLDVIAAEVVRADDGAAAREAVWRPPAAGVGVIELLRDRPGADMRPDALRRRRGRR
jgi:hypothetical protein